MSDEEYQDFYAICNHMPEAERALRVGGKVMCPQSGWSARLEPTQGNTGINPLMLHLDLVLTRPQDGSIEVMTLVDIDEWREEPPAAEYEQVEFHRSDGTPPPTIDVEHTQ